MANGEPVNLSPLYEMAAQEQKPGGGPNTGDFQRDLNTQLRGDEIIFSNHWKVTSPTERTLSVDSDPKLKQLAGELGGHGGTFQATLREMAKRNGADVVQFTPVLILRISEKDYTANILPHLAK